MSFLALVLVALVLRFTPWRSGFPVDLLSVLVRSVATHTLSRPIWLAIALLVLPLLLCGLLLWLADGLAYGLVTLLLHALVLLLCVGRSDPLGSMASNIEEAWQRGDQEAAALLAERDLQLDATSPESLVLGLRGELAWESFQGYFAPAFWYLLLGPVGALLYRLIANFQRQGEHPLQPIMSSARHALDWLPARLVGLSLALVGHFDRVLLTLRVQLLNWDTQSRELIALCVESAQSATLDDQGEAVRIMRPVRILLTRSLMVWAVCVAFINLIG